MESDSKPTATHFYSSNNSTVGRNRRWLWYGFGAVLLATFAVSKGSFTALLMTTFIVMPVVALLDWRCRYFLKQGHSLVTVTAEGIASSFFAGPRRSYRWNELAAATVRQIGGHDALAFIMAERSSSGLRALLRIKHPDPHIPLSALSHADRTELLATATGAIAYHNPSVGPSAGDQVREIEAAAQFEERLKTLAPYPWITYILVALNIVAWGVTLVVGAELLKSPVPQLFAWGGNAASEVQRGEWWRLFTAMFLHSGILHVGMNMVGLLAAGITVERIFGHRQFALIYVGSGLLGGALSLHFGAQTAVSVGASGAVFGVAGALLVAVFQHRETLPKVFTSRTLSSMGFFVLYSLLQGFGKQGIDNAAHVGGLLGGMALAYILPERFDLAYFGRRFRASFMAAAAVLGGSVFVVSASAPIAAVDQRQIIENTASFEKGMQGLQKALAALSKDQKAVKTGEMTALEADERTRAVFAPQFRRVYEQLSRVRLMKDDPRQPFVMDSLRFAELMAEILAMESVLNERTGNYDPADKVRGEAINKEITEIDARMMKWADAVSRKKGR